MCCRWFKTLSWITVAKDDTKITYLKRNPNNILKKKEKKERRNLKGRNLKTQDQT